MTNGSNKIDLKNKLNVGVCKFFNVKNTNSL
jgi:hypothetical protein